MNYELFSMNIIKTFNKLFEKILGIIFFKLSSLPDICQKISSLTKLHHEAHMPWCFECVVQPYNVIMTTLLQNSHLLHNSFLLVLLISQNFSLDRLDSNQVLTNFMAC